MKSNEIKAKRDASYINYSQRIAVLATLPSVSKQLKLWYECVADSEEVICKRLTAAITEVKKVVSNFDSLVIKKISSRYRDATKPRFISYYYVAQIVDRLCRQYLFDTNMPQNTRNCIARYLRVTLWSKGRDSVCVYDCNTADATPADATPADATPQKTPKTK